MNTRRLRNFVLGLACIAAVSLPARAQDAEISKMMAEITKLSAEQKQLPAKVKQSLALKRQNEQ
jgi:septal ring factor EnvC (AmiA/AmiB activator)